MSPNLFELWNMKNLGKTFQVVKHAKEVRESLFTFLVKSFHRTLRFHEFLVSWQVANGNFDLFSFPIRKEHGKWFHINIQNYKVTCHE